MGDVQTINDTLEASVIPSAVFSRKNTLKSAEQLKMSDL